MVRPMYKAIWYLKEGDLSRVKNGTDTKIREIHDSDTLFFRALHYRIVSKKIITCLVNIYQLNLAILYQTRHLPFIFS